MSSCAHMCPRAEVLERSRTNEISRFERPAPHMRSPQHGSLDVFGLAVKKYRRPAAGRIEIDPTQLRPPRVLLETLAHLFTDVLLWPGCGFAWHAPNAHEDDANANPRGRATASEFLALYHFISDRVRSRIEDDVAVQALEQIVRFYVLASLRARQLLPPQPSGHEHVEWSEQLNDQQLASALSQLQVLYRKNDALDEGTNGGGDSSESQSEFVTYDILLHADDPRAISLMLLQVPERVRRSPAVKRALTLFVALQLQDLHSFFRLFSIASPLEKSLLLKHLPAMWKSSVEMMSKAFGKQDRFPLDEFAKWLHLSGHIEAQMLCNAMNLHMEETQQLDAVPSIPKVTESWEDGDAAALEPPVAPPVGFIRFKLVPLNAEIDRALTQRLLVDMAKRIQRLEIEERLQSASDLVRRLGLSQTVKQTESE
uniref:SAC3/GANP/THP3 conserved domain-containing protein n=1 Tax=Globisporangium ultimum (strain ATCC 200006 / CBS 805.95 / DAOM BR144) TaxID=431595 RepID=K3WBH6_GLOUD